jgi:hypothetical protein
VLKTITILGQISKKNNNLMAWGAKGEIPILAWARIESIIFYI